MILGTAGYMSPEQARGQPVDKRTDIWAFGCVLFEMCAHQPPFAGATISDALAAVIEREPDWELLRAGTPPSLVRLLRRCLTKDPKLRLRDIGEARIALEQGTDTADVAPRSTTRRAGGDRCLPGYAALASLSAFAIFGPAAPESSSVTFARAFSGSSARGDGLQSPSGPNVLRVVAGRIAVGVCRLTECGACFSGRAEPASGSAPWRTSKRDPLPGTDGADIGVLVA